MRRHLREHTVTKDQRRVLQMIACPLELGCASCSQMNLRRAGRSARELGRDTAPQLIRVVLRALDAVDGFEEIKMSLLIQPSELPGQVDDLFEARERAQSTLNSIGDAVT